MPDGRRTSQDAPMAINCEPHSRRLSDRVGDSVGDLGLDYYKVLTRHRARLDHVLGFSACCSVCTRASRPPTALLCIGVLW